MTSLSQKGSALVEQAVSVLRGHEGPYVALTGGIVLLSFAFGIYGIFSNFIPLASVHRWNEPAAWVAGAIAALSALYLVIEVTRRRDFRAIATAMALAGFGGYMAMSDGIPTMFSVATASPATVVFTVDRPGWGGKRCYDAVIVVHPDYVEQNLCGNSFSGRRPQVGDRVAFTGRVSRWGLNFTGYRIAR